MMHADVPPQPKNASSLAEKLVAMELELALMDAAYMGDAGVEEEQAIRRELLPRLIAQWSRRGMLGHVEILAIRHQVHAAVEAWIDQRTVPVRRRGDSPGVLLRLWRCIRQCVSV